jgi:hypothetical protein
MLYKQEGKLLSKDEVLMMTYNTGGCNTPSPKTANNPQAKIDEDDYSSGDNDCMNQPLEVRSRIY